MSEAPDLSPGRRLLRPEVTRARVLPTWFVPPADRTSHSPARLVVVCIASFLGYAVMLASYDYDGIVTVPASVVVVEHDRSGQRVVALRLAQSSSRIPVEAGLRIRMGEGARTRRSNARTIGFREGNVLLVHLAGELPSAGGTVLLEVRERRPLWRWVRLSSRSMQDGVSK